jgi:hypothetical protein
MILLAQSAGAPFFDVSIRAIFALCVVFIAVTTDYSFERR